MFFFDPEIAPDGNWEADPDGTLIWRDNKVMSCCNKPARETWNGKTAQWECSHCGAVKSNDPNYLNSIYMPKAPWSSSAVTPTPEVKNVRKCECGSSSVGSDKHQDYCQLYEK